MLQIHEKDEIIYDDSCPKKVIAQVTLSQRLEMARAEIERNTEPFGMSRMKGYDNAYRSEWMHYLAPNF